MEETKARNAIGDGVVTSTTSRSLLENLRSAAPTMVVVNPSTEDEARAKMKLIIENRLEFPTRLRKAITKASRSALKTSDDREEPSAELFLSEVYKASKSFLFSEPIITINEDDNDNGNGNGNIIENNNEEFERQTKKEQFSWWHGLNSDIDTEDEAELAIRLFPSILMEKQNVSPLSSMNDCYPIYMLLSCSKAIPFIPLLAELGVELGSGRFVKEERGGLTCFMRNVIFNLIRNNVLRDNPDKEDSSSIKLDELSATVMTRLKEKGLMKVIDIYEYDLIEILLFSPRRRNRRRKLEVKQRFRALVDLNPSILVDCGRGICLMRRYLHDFLSGTDGCEVKERVSLPTFRMIFELGMSRFPKELGFVFYDTNFKIACEVFGTETVSRIVDYELSTKIGEKKNSKCQINVAQDLSVAAVSNSEISLDGVYTLLRRDPMIMLRECHKP